MLFELEAAPNGDEEAASSEDSTAVELEVAVINEGQLEDVLEVNALEPFEDA